jgi:hypothetical protein
MYFFDLSLIDKQIVTTASLGAVSSISYVISLVSFGLVGLALQKFSTRCRELTEGAVSEKQSDFLDVKSPILVAGFLTVGVVISVVVAINDWEKSRYSESSVT